jgi:hypothetical protein
VALTKSKEVKEPYQQKIHFSWLLFYILFCF